jgi:hypothetical protein
VAAELQATWAELLGVSSDHPAGGAIVCSSDRLQGPVERRFAAPHPGWPGARHHSPDVLIAAPGVAALAAGDFTLVLGELHVGLNTVAPFHLQHPWPDGLREALEADLERPRIAPVWSKRRSLADIYSIARHDYDVEQGDARSRRPQRQVLAEKELMVSRQRGQLVVAPRSMEPCFDIIAYLEQHLVAESYSEFALLGPAGHRPRVTIDRLIVQREAWTFPAEGRPPFSEKQPERDRFLAVRKWAQRHRLPRFAFARVQGEAKPYFVDFDSPLYVDNLARLAARSESLRLVEMVPAPTDLWLSDALGHRYTSELRLACVDPMAFPAVWP